MTPENNLNQKPENQELSVEEQILSTREDVGNITSVNFGMLKEKGNNTPLPDAKICDKGDFKNHRIRPGRKQAEMESILKAMGFRPVSENEAADIMTGTDSIDKARKPRGRVFRVSTNPDK